MILLLVACGEPEAPDPGPPAAPEPAKVGKGPMGKAGKAGPPGPPPGGPCGPGGPVGPPGMSFGAEDLAGSWSDELAVDVAKVEALSCPEGMALVPAGPFLMGSVSAQAGADEGPVHVVRTGSFCVDLHEVAVEDFAAWLRASGRRAEGTDLRSTSPEGAVEEGRLGHPAEGVTWEEARDYCLSQGKRLPSEAEWEKAARGGCELGDDPARCDPGDLRPYPWGSEAPSCELANHAMVGVGAPELCVSDTQPVAAGSAGPYGSTHQAGNVWEWVGDVYHPRLYRAGRPEDPGGPAEGSLHGMRGGGWNTFSTNMRTGNRFNDLVIGSAVGMRCVQAAHEPVVEDVEPVTMAELSGTLSYAKGPIAGRALYVSAFDERDAKGADMPPPGMSPVADVRFEPSGQAEQAFTIQVPAGASYLVYAALDDGSGADKDDYKSASGSGGMGRAAQNPVQVDGDVEGLSIHIEAPPAMGPP